MGILTQISSAMGSSTTGELAKTGLKSLAVYMTGLVLMKILSFTFSIKRARKTLPKWYLLEIVMLFSCLFIGRSVNGAKAWIQIPFFRVGIQPSEFAKIIVILIVAVFLGDIPVKQTIGKNLLKKPLVMIGIIILDVMLVQSDFGTAMIILIISSSCILVPSHPQLEKAQLILKVSFWFSVVAAVFLLSPFGEAAVSGIPFLKTYQKARFLTAIDPFSDPFGNGYQLIKGLTSFARGGLFGVGIGNSLIKYGQFPAATTDYVLSIFVEETGFLGFAVIMFFYATIIIRLFVNAMSFNDERAQIVLCGTAVYLLLHLFFNILGVTGLIPLTGIPLLLLSSGGSSSTAFLMGIGICQAIISAHRKPLIKESPDLQRRPIIN